MFTQRVQSQPVIDSPRPTRDASSSTREKSVIGNDLKIVGQGLKILSQGILQVDGEIEGDVEGAEVIVGSSGKVTGKIVGRRIDVCGTVVGVVCGSSVVLKSSSSVEGDIHHLSLAIETGAQFEGSSRHASSEQDLAGAGRQ